MPFFISGFPFGCSDRKRISSQQQDVPDTALLRGGLRFYCLAESLPDELAQDSVLGELQTLLRRSVLLRVPDLQDDLAGLVGCARKHVLRLARLRKRQD